MSHNELDAVVDGAARALAAALPAGCRFAVLLVDERHTDRVPVLGAHSFATDAEAAESLTAYAELLGDGTAEEEA